MTQKTVLILDDDLGFSMWLGRAINEAGIRALPASRSCEALAMVEAGGLPQVDLLIVNFRVDGWKEVLDTLAAQGGSCKVISIGAKGKHVVNGTLRRPRGMSLPSPQRYVKMVCEALQD